MLEPMFFASLRSYAKDRNNSLLTGDDGANFEPGWIRRQ